MKCLDIMTMDPMMCVPEDAVSIAIGIMWNNDCGVVPNASNKWIMLS